MKRVSCRSSLKIGVIILSTVLTVGAGNAHAQTGDSIVLVGVGNAGSWITEVVGSNPGGSLLWAQVNFEPTFHEPGPCPALCPIVYFMIAPDGTHALQPDRVGHFAAGDRVTTIYVTPPFGTPLPSVRARVVNTLRPSQAIEVPAFKLSTLLALNPSALSFPGASRTETTRTNLALANLRRAPGVDSGSVSARVEAFSAGGQNLGSTLLLLASGETRFLVDVLPDLGVHNLEVGQLRVTKQAGDGYLWGTMFTTSADGSFTVSIGANP